MTVPQAPFDGAGLQPGDTFAAHYRLMHRIRTEAAWDVWRAEDLTMNLPVALRMVPANAVPVPELLESVRTARRLSHPSLCRIFEAGVAQGCFYCAMELIGGESLRTVLRRVGRLPQEKVVQIGLQVCGGLAAVHARGGVHGHLDAGNVFLDPDGEVRIVGVGFSPAFSIAAPAASGERNGYLAPEQCSPGGQITPRTDLYAVGVLLYELLTGTQPPASGSSVPRKPSSLVPGVGGRLERVVMQALENDPRARPASAAAVAAHLTIVSPSATPRRRAASIAGALLAAVIGLLAVIATWLVPRAPAATVAHDAIVLADVGNTTGEPVFDGALKIALAVALEQSPFLRVFADDRARETLRLMHRPPDERLTVPLAREIARREQLKALVAGSIEPQGTGYALVLEAIEAETGDVIARERVEAPGQDDVLAALGTAAARLRVTLGETLASIRQFDVPLPQATTPSLEALHAYALAHDEGRVVPRAEAIPHLQRALELDPNFAMAHAALSGVYRNIGRSAEAPEHSRRAFELRDRVSERERFFISWRYYVDAAQAWDKALEVAVSWTQTYPREAFAFNSLGLAAGAFGDHEQAARAFREAIRLDPKFVPPHGNLAGSLLAQDRFGDARTELDEASQHGIDFITVRRMRFLLALIENDREAMTREADLLRQSPDAPWASILEARAALFAGRFDAAHDLFQAGVRAVVEDNSDELAAQWAMEDAEAHAIAGTCGQARGELRAGIELSRDSFTLERAARTLALCGDSAAASRMAGELASRFPAATLTTRLQVPLIRAADALRRGDAPAVIAALDAVTRYDRAPAAEFWPAFLRGEAYLLMKDGPAAQEQFRSIVEHRGVAPTSPLYPLARLKLARAEALTGSTAAARGSYEAGFALWSHADPGLPPLRRARAEYDGLR